MAPGLGLSSAIAILGFRRRALSRSGALGALLVGTGTYVAGTWRWSALLLSFFATSSALSRLESRSASGAAIAAVAERGSRRDLVQVLANGGVATGIALWHAVAPHELLDAGFAGAYAAANADTWATEIGGTSRKPPRHILTGAVVAPGTSGGVTPNGLLGAAAGASLIGLVAGLVRERRPHMVSLKPHHRDLPSSLRHGMIVAAAGLTGSLIDSIAGGSIQASYRCPHCGVFTERRLHRCGTRTVLERGRSWCTNDLVNVLCTGSGAVIAMAAARWFFEPGGNNEPEDALSGLNLFKRVAGYTV